MNAHQRIAIVIVDIAIILELCVSIYFANQNPEDFNPIFFKTFFSMLIPTLVVAKLAVKRFRSAQSAEPQPAK